MIRCVCVCVRNSGPQRPAVDSAATTPLNPLRLRFPGAPARFPGAFPRSGEGGIPGQVTVLQVPLYLTTAPLD
jgi:hypothetical protein